MTQVHDESRADSRSGSSACSGAHVVETRSAEAAERRRKVEELERNLPEVRCADCGELMGYIGDGFFYCNHGW